MTYRVQVERDESGAWIARVPAVPGCHTYGRTLRQVRGRIREALTLWVDDADTVDLEWHVRLPAAVRKEIRTAKAIRERAAKAHRDAQSRAAYAARELTRKYGLSLRDVAELMGLSHQRVQQLVTAEPQQGLGTTATEPTRGGSTSSQAARHRARS
jgi:predicted RNase H-like HicB family nuclease